MTVSSPPFDFKPAFEEAQKLHAQGRLEEAEAAYQRLAATGEQREMVLGTLVELYLQAQQPQRAVDTLVALTEEAPDELRYYAQLAGLLESLGDAEAAIGVYRRLLVRQPGMAAAHFNLALIHKKNLRYPDALAAYEEAVRLGIRDVQEVYSNMGVLYSEMRDADKADEMYVRALEVDPQYLPALFNRAGLLEEAGERDAAIEMYRRILSIAPRHWDSLARIAYAKKVTSADDELVTSLQQAVENEKEDQLGREGLYFALGKALDDLERYEEAFAAYDAANELGRLRNPPYDRGAVEQGFDQLIELFDAEWIARVATDSTASPIFVCGMFRSGSTLIEQILASHPAVTAGGELGFMPWLLLRKLAPYPQRARSASREELEQIGGEYWSSVRGLFPGSENITDKRPDNFLHLGLIKAMFPRARMIYTKRNREDNCLSLYFQQLGGALGYAADLGNAVHYYQQHERLMAHWMTCFGDDIFTVDYDVLVSSPEPVLRGLTDFLGLEWDDRCLDFQQADSQVKTASVWQVREALHPRSSGRWRHYEPFARKKDSSI